MAFTPSTSTLVGEELLSFVKQNQGMGKTELAVAAGYVSTTKEGKQRTNLSAMQDALCAAVGIKIGGKSEVGPGGRKLSYTARIQGNGNLLVGNAYTKKLGLEPGAEFDIKISKQTGTIRLVPVGGADDED